ncbi:hypothetical protein VTJ04DRAFT_8751 [Mycothermus thermophilus]|uniref:uncharacterized protein n=1 Tax=Humicola insolens TaxID=85995 RepID=UPI003741F828
MCDDCSRQNPPKCIAGVIHEKNPDPKNTLAQVHRRLAQRLLPSTVKKRHRKHSTQPRIPNPEDFFMMLCSDECNSFFCYKPEPTKEN